MDLFISWNNDFITSARQTCCIVNNGVKITPNDDFKWPNDNFSVRTVSSNGKTNSFIKSVLTEFKESCKITSNDDLISSMIKNEKLALLKEVEKKLTGG